MATATLEKPTQKKAPSTGKASSSRKPKKNAARQKQISPLRGTVQMNVRIDATKKEAGDNAFAHIGLTPSQAVRALWEFAARNGNDPAALRTMIAELEGEQEDEEALSEKERRLKTLHEGWALMDNFRKERGLVCDIPEDDDERMAYYDELREEAYWERLEERELL